MVVVVERLVILQMVVLVVVQVLHMLEVMVDMVEEMHQQQYFTIQVEEEDMHLLAVNLSLQHH
jgi:hypothetical protein